MLIACPNCATSYQVDPAAIEPQGRSVRCARCKTVWFATPAAATDGAPIARSAALALESSQAAPEHDPAKIREFESPEAADSSAAPTADGRTPEPGSAASTAAGSQGLGAAGATQDSGPEAAGSEPAQTAPAVEEANAASAVALSEIPIPIENAPPLVPGHPDDQAPPRRQPPEPEAGEDIETVAARRRGSSRTGRRQASKRGTRLPLLIFVLVAVNAALIGWRKEIVRHAPQLASFYAAIGLPVNLRGLAFVDVTVGKRMHDGIPVLFVQGSIENTVAAPVEIPRLRFAIRNAVGAEVYAWTLVPSQSVLAPGEKLPFRTQLASPPKDTHDVQVRFFTRRDAVAGLH